MADIPYTLVKTAAEAIRHGSACTTEDIAREALDAVWDDLRRARESSFLLGYAGGLDKRGGDLSDPADIPEALLEKAAQALSGRPTDHYCTNDSRDDARAVLAAVLPDAMARAWNKGYEKRAETLGMTADPNPYRADTDEADR